MQGCLSIKVGNGYINVEMTYWTILVKFRWNSRLKVRIFHVTPTQPTYLTFPREYFFSPSPMLRFEFHRSLPSSKSPHFQNEAKCTTVLMKTSFICIRIKNHFQIKGWALNLVLIQRPGGTRKWSIANGWYVNNIWVGGDATWQVFFNRCDEYCRLHETLICFPDNVHWSIRLSFAAWQDYFCE